MVRLLPSWALYGLLSLSSFTSAAAAQEDKDNDADDKVRSSLLKCFKSADVPFNKKNSTEYKIDSKPFNLRLPYEPIAIAVPKTTKQISEAVKCGVKHDLRVAAKCGGHSYASYGFGGEDGQVVIELDRMFKVKVLEDGVSATVQGGARLGHVAAELWEQGERALSHGTCPGVGVSGHALHGGYGMASHTYGLMLDRITSMEVVLATGEVVTASKDENEDLFWALRGAGSSFGIVAEFTFETFPAPEESTTFTLKTPWANETEMVRGLKAVQDWVLEGGMPKELNMRLTADASGIGAEGVFYGDKDGLKKVLEPVFNETGAYISQSAEGNWKKGLEHFTYGTPLNQTTPYDMHETFYSTSLTSGPFTTKQFTSFVTYALYNTSLPGFSRRWWIQLDLHGGPNAAIPSLDPESSATSYPHRNDMYLIQFYDSLFTGTYPKDGFKLLQGFVASLTESGDEKETEQGELFGKYVNYADSQVTGEEANRLYWRGSLERLRGVKRKYDAGEVFWNPSSVRP